MKWGRKYHGFGNNIRWKKEKGEAISSSLDNIDIEAVQKNIKWERRGKYWGRISIYKELYSTPPWSDLQLWRTPTPHPTSPEGPKVVLVGFAGSSKVQLERLGNLSYQTNFDPPPFIATAWTK